MAFLALVMPVTVVCAVRPVRSITAMAAAVFLSVLICAVSVCVAIDINECSSNPCVVGRGTCVDLVNGFSCTCNAGYSGVRCQTGLSQLYLIYNSSLHFLTYS